MGKPWTPRPAPTAYEGSQLDQDASPSHFATHLQTRELATQAELNRIGGSRKGKLNRQTVRIKQAIEQVFGDLGGWEGMRAWAMDNPDAFYGQVVPKLLPKAMVSDELGGVTIVINSLTKPSEKPLDVISTVEALPHWPHAPEPSEQE